tara:strand:+ start:208 stop:372 length:165 start_codon:yes stop_codon:yes gene_type:complete
MLIKNISDQAIHTEISDVKPNATAEVSYEMGMFLIRHGRAELFIQPAVKAKKPD